MKTIAKITLLGIVGQDPKVQPTKNGGVIATFPVATTSKKKDPNGAFFDSTLWHNAIAFGKLAENIEKTVTKAAKIYIDGTIDYQEYVDSNGTQKLSTKILINDFSVVSKTEYTQAKEQSQSYGNRRDEKYQDTRLDDDIPF